jgi:hypothetical protein
VVDLVTLEAGALHEFLYNKLTNCVYQLYLKLWSHFVVLLKFDFDALTSNKLDEIHISAPVKHSLP